jgi:probable F420-dependent oxidoreductase
VTQFGVVIPANGEWGDRAMILDAIHAAEDLGFHTAWFGDHVVIPQYAAHLSEPRWFDSVSCMLVGAGATTTIRFATDVLVLPYRNPVVLSQILASGDQLSNGRLTLGVGVGYISGEFAAVGSPSYERRGAVTDEYLRAMRALWDGDGPVSFSGEWVQFADVLAEPKPAQTPFPVFVGGNGKRALQRAATLGNGWHPLFPTPENYAAGRTEIERIRAEAGASAAGPFTFSYSCPLVHVMLDESERPTAVPYTERSDIPDEYRYAPPFPVADGGRARFTGTPDDIAADVRAYVEAGVEHFALRFHIGEPGFDIARFTEQLERFSRLVIPNTGD